MNLDELLLIPADRINYAALDVGQVVALATQNEEPYIATNALGELRERKAVEAWDAAERIVLGGGADRHLMTFGIETLWDLDVERSVGIMARVVEGTTDPKILGAMIEAVLVYPENFGSGVGRDFVVRLVNAVRASKPDKFTDLDDRKAFLERFGLPADS